MIKKLPLISTMAAARVYHDPSRCLENGVYDNDCCAVKGYGYCFGNSAQLWGDMCYDGGD